MPADLRSHPFWAGVQDYLSDRHPHDELRSDILEATHTLVWLTADELAGRTQPPAKHLPPGVESADPGVLGTNAWADGIRPEVPVWLTVRDDPNTGHAPSEDSVAGGYTDRWDLDEAVLARIGRAPHHLGETAFAVQWMPEGLTPWFLELSDDLAGVNYGDGIAQIDLESETFDWACG